MAILGIFEGWMEKHYRLRTVEGSKLLYLDVWNKINYVPYASGNLHILKRFLKAVGIGADEVDKKIQDFITSNF